MTVGPACLHCGEELEGRYTLTHFGLDARIGEGTAYVTYQACCDGMQYDVEEYGYERCYGRTIADVVREITGEEVLSVEGSGDGSIVCRLKVADPTIAGPRDAAGRAVAESPKGWRDEVFALVDKHHRHHDRPQGHKFSVAVHNGRVRVGVATVGRPVSRVIQKAQPHTLEVTRVATWGESPLRRNASSKLYGACADRARRLGYDKLITYTLADEESGASLVASGFTPTNVSADDRHWTTKSRPRETTAPTGAKVRWERGLTPKTRKDVAARRITVGG